MEEIQYVINERRERIAVMINLQTYGDLWGDFYDCLTARSRADEPRETLESVKKRLQRQGKLDG